MLSAALIGRNAEYLSVNKGFTMNIIVAGAFISLFPEFMKPCVVCCLRSPCAGDADHVGTGQLRSEAMQEYT